MSNEPFARPFGRPAAQKNLDRATELAFEDLQGQDHQQLVWLGAESVDNGWKLPVLEDILEIDLGKSRVRTSGRQAVGPLWRILALHYLAIRPQPERLAPEVTFADLPAARSYASVYEGRVIGRLCATAGRNADRLRDAAVALKGHRALGGDLAFDFDVFPRLTIRLIWHGADEEFPPSATLLLPANIDSYFCSEDVVVLSEQLVARLGGRPF